ncbi:hypothetical protein [Mycobacteroides abscessus]|uniref:hypothetical protein n=1 Tax=Mycobacteroides abscessus TaxID=36809 RepID=UPI0009408AFB|nr:hypothetical protein [Mycobacteroides abscessus]
MTDAIQRFRMKPVEVEAVRYEVHVRHDWDGASAVAAWCGGKFFPGAPGDFPQKPGYPHIELASGEWVDPGDWIVRGIDGKFTRCSPDVFELTHELTNQSVRHRYRNVIPDRED